MISEGSYDTEDWSNYAENADLITEINYILKHIYPFNPNFISQTWKYPNDVSLVTLWKYIYIYFFLLFVLEKCLLILWPHSTKLNICEFVY